METGRKAPRHFPTQQLPSTSLEEYGRILTQSGVRQFCWQRIRGERGAVSN
jgi:hypothetical protein